MFPCMLNYSSFTTMTNVECHVSRGMGLCKNPVFYWLAFEKLPENPVVSPSGSTQVVAPSAVNRYLQTVTVNPVSTTSLTVTPSAEVQTFSDGYYNPVTVEATA